MRLYKTTTLINYSLLLAMVLDYHRMAGYVVLYNVTVLGIGFGIISGLNAVLFSLFDIKTFCICLIILEGETL